MRLFKIYHREREYARSLNDPCLGTIEASTKEQAERIARNLYPTMTGIIAVENI